MGTTEDQKLSWKMLETKAEWEARLARENAFWNRPNDEVLADLTWKTPNAKKSEPKPLLSSVPNVVFLSEWKRCYRA
jgi:hypothetical protein